ncbi:MAG: PorT family protein [Lentimicrobiaceae bacterium]|nr:PorT family protein [Lentimicrobiaceae bacterium]
MKKVLLLFAALFVATIANAQFDICVGPKVGYQATKLSLDKQSIKSSFKGNMTFGVFGRVTIKKFIVQPELLYFKSGKVFEVSVLGDNFGIDNPALNPTFTINQANLALPIFLGYQFLDLDLIKMRANVGPVFYFAVGGTEYVYPSPIGNGTSYVTNNTSPNEEMTLGAALNLGVDVWRFTLDINYSLGLTDAFDDEIEIPGVGEFEVDDDTKQNIFTVTLGFKLL